MDRKTDSRYAEALPCGLNFSSLQEENARLKDDDGACVGETMAVAQQPKYETKDWKVQRLREDGAQRR